MNSFNEPTEKTGYLEQDFRLFHKSAGNGKTLTLSTGKVFAILFQLKIHSFHFGKNRIFLFEEIEKNREIISIGNPGPGRSSWFDPTKKFSAEGWESLRHFPQLFYILNIFLFVIG